MGGQALLRQVADRIDGDEDFAMSVGEDPRAALTAAGLDGTLIDSVLTDEVAGFGQQPRGQLDDAERQALVRWVAGRARDLASA